MDTKNEGQRLLHVALAKRGEAAKLAERLNVTPGAVSRWLTGRKPETATRFELEREYGIPVLSWDQSPADEPQSGDAA